MLYVLLPVANVMVMHRWDSIIPSRFQAVQYTQCLVFIFIWSWKRDFRIVCLLFRPKNSKSLFVVDVLSLTYKIRENETFIDEILCCECNSGTKCWNKIAICQHENNDRETSNDWRDTAREQLKSTDDLIIYCYFFASVHLERTRYAIHSTRLPKAECSWTSQIWK